MNLKDKSLEAMLFAEEAVCRFCDPLSPLEGIRYMPEKNTIPARAKAITKNYWALTKGSLRSAVSGAAVGAITGVASAYFSGAGSSEAYATAQQYAAFGAGIYLLFYSLAAHHRFSQYTDAMAEGNLSFPDVRK